jgi:hypothetical protein
MNVEDRLRNALEDHAASVPTPPDRWSEVEADAARLRRRNRWRTGGFTGLGLVAAAVVAVVAVSALSDGGQLVETSPADDPPATVAPVEDTRPLLWPFRTEDEARQWQQEGEPEGHSPWHADAEATALAFTTGYLRFTEVDGIVDSEISGREARVTVGYPGESEDRLLPAATIELIRLGDGPDAPWEVVGTAGNEHFSITAPADGATVVSPLVVSGLITGVDESVHVEVRQPSSPEPLGKSPCCGAEGGENFPWQRTVVIEGPTDPVLTVVAHAGGHLTDVERFVVVGVRYIPS